MYATPDFDVYDLAVLKCDPKAHQLLEMSSANVSLRRAQIGKSARQLKALVCELMPAILLIVGILKQWYRGLKVLF